MVSQEAMAAMLAQSFGPMLEALRDAVNSSAASVASASALHVNMQHAACSAAGAAASAAPRAAAPEFHFERMTLAVPTVAGCCGPRSELGPHWRARDVLCPYAVVLRSGVPAR